MRLIDADALLKYLMLNMGWHDEDGYEVDDWDEKQEIIKNLIDGVPTIDAVPVVHARWMECTGDSRLMCSVCKNKEHVPTINGEPMVWWYCPSCGAKMDKEGDRE